MIARQGQEEVEVAEAKVPNERLARVKVWVPYEVTTKLEV
jgi:hypothetical protein